MKIAGYEKLSIQDFPNHISCIVFTQGCNLKCPFCQNSSLIPMNADMLVDEKEVIDYLELRKNILNGLTISGGEPLLQQDIKTFIKKVKQIGLDIKVDTNGTNYNLLKELIEDGLVDYVAMDIKNSLSKYDKTAGTKQLNMQNILNSIELLKQNKVDYEFRTTVVSEHHTLQDILEIIQMIGNSKYYLQNFKNSAAVLDKNLTEIADAKLLLWNEVLKNYPNVFIRGIEKEEQKCTK